MLAPTLAMKIRPDGSPACLLTYSINDGRKAVCEMYAENGERKYRYLVVASDGKSAQEYISCYTHSKLSQQLATPPALPPFSESDLHDVLERLSKTRNFLTAAVFLPAPGFVEKQWVLNPPLPESENEASEKSPYEE